LSGHEQGRWVVERVGQFVMLGGFAFACSLSAGALLALAVAVASLPGLLAEPVGLIDGTLLLQAGSALLAALGVLLGAASFRNSWGTAAALGGLALLALNAAYFFWAFLLQG
jgi:hypothetical protein